MENKPSDQSVPDIEQAEEATAEELTQDESPKKKEKHDVQEGAPEVETPRVPDADTEGIP